MVGLLDIAPSSKTVHGIKVTGVSVEGLISILQRYPELRAILLRTTAKGFDATDLLTLAPKALAAVIAAGIGHAGDAAQEEAAGRLSLEMQADFLEAIIAATLPSGFGPFVERLMTLATRVEGNLPQVAAAPSKATATPPNGRTSPAKGKPVAVKAKTSLPTSAVAARALVKSGKTRKL